MHRCVTTAVSLAVASVLAEAGPLSGDMTPVPVGGQIQVNSYTTGNQDAPSVAVLQGGGFVVSWSSNGSGGGDSSGYSVQARRYSAAGLAEGGQLQVNSYTTAGQSAPRVAGLAGGGFVVTWTSSGSGAGDTSGTSLQARLFAGDGTPLAGELQVNSYTTGDQLASAVAAGSTGDFVVVWQSSGSSGVDTSFTSVQGQRFSAAGEPQGAQFEVNGYTTGYQSLPEVAKDPNADFVVAWQSAGSSGTDANGTSIQDRRFSADGTPLGGQFQVNSYTTGNQLRPSVAAGVPGGFVVAWTSAGSGGGDTSSYSIQDRPLSVTGAPAVSQLEINSYTTDGQVSARVAPLADGSFVVVWSSLGSSGSDTSGYSIQGCRVSSTGVPLGSQFQINSYAPGDQVLPAVAADAAGNFVVAWQSFGSSGGDSSGRSIQARRFTLAIFRDGFEGGTTDAWDVVLP
jgi:hypothetical protein